MVFWEEKYNNEKFKSLQKATKWGSLIVLLITGIYLVTLKGSAPLIGIFTILGALPLLLVRLKHEEPQFPRFHDLKERQDLKMTT